MGVQQAIGGTVAWHVEFDTNPSKILDHHWPDVPNYGDITTVDFTQVEQVDVLTGGFPCQDVSHAGRRKGLIRDGDGQTRSGLWGHMLRAINEQRPALVVAENVRGLLSATADSDMEPCPWCVGGAPGGEPPLRALGAVLADLADSGYDAAWAGLRAADVGAPHGRFRVFILAWPTTDTAVLRGNGAGRGRNRSAGARIWPAPDRSGLDRCALTLLPSPRTSDTNGAGHHGDGGMDLRTAVTLLPTPAVNDMGSAYTPDERDAWTEKMRAAHGNGNGHGASLHVEALRLLPTPVVTDANGARNETSGRQPGAVFASGRTLGDVTYLDAFGEYAPAIARWEHVLGRPAPAPTEPTGKAGAHRLSPRFVEWMMGLPAGHVTDVPDLSRNAQLKALGNGVVPQQAAAALTHLLAIREHAIEVAA